MLPSSSAPLSRREQALALTTLLSLCAAAFSPWQGAAAAKVAVAPAGPTFTQAGRTVIVTGSSKGIGKGIAKVFAEAGANVLLTSRHYDEAEAAANEIIAAGGVAYPFAGDVSVEADVIKMIDTAVKEFGGIDVLCANAGMHRTELRCAVEPRCRRLRRRAHC